MRPILALGEPGCEDPSITGGKAASLGRLFAEFSVPPGFCLTAATYAATGVSVALARLVADAYTALAVRCGEAEPAVAVRSSAIDEDGAQASFAGIYASYLNVRGVDAVLEAIGRCWASAADPRVAAYRASRGLATAGVGVLVQALVPADSSAVVFSANPATGTADEVVINANYGLGESIVGGAASPDMWILEQPGLTLVRFQPGAKEQMTVLVADGTREVAVPRTLRRRACLTGAQVQELGRLAVRLAAVIGRAVDFESAYRGEALYLLQCRPITTGRAR